MKTLDAALALVGVGLGLAAWLIGVAINRL